MNRIDAKFKQLAREKKKAFIAFITCGDPTLATTYKLALALNRLGVDILELGVPFSDPLADGPTIQAASQRALKNRINLTDVFKLVRELRRKIELPIVLLAYCNMIYHYGTDGFVKQAKSCGVDGVVIPDLPVEEAKELIKLARKTNFATIFLLSPTSDPARISKVSSSASGFIYYVSLTGTTGARKSLPKELIKQVRKIKRVTAKPVCVGFGVSSPEQVKQISRVADWIIVGSAIIKVIEKNLGRRELVSSVAKFVRRLKQAI